MIPEIKFIYSTPYDKHWFEFFKALKISDNYPTKEVLVKQLEKLEEYWNLKGSIILESISECSKLEWRLNLIECFIVGKAAPFSSPLTMPIKLKGRKIEDIESWIDIFIHELIHNILIENYWNKLPKLKSYLDSLGELLEMTYNHIPVHAIHYLVYKDIFNEQRLNNDIENCKLNSPDYYKSWQIVLDKGAENIVELFK